MDPPNDQESGKKSDAQVEMIEQFDKLKFQNQTLKAQCDRLQKLLDEITCSNDNQRICQCGRKLRYISSVTDSKNNPCIKCHKPLIDVSNVWWSCSECKYHVCVECQGYKKCVCPFSHFMEFSKFNADIEEQEENAQGEYDIMVVGLQRIKSKSKRKCDICRKQISSNFYTCTCGFDMCKPCRDK